MADRMWLQAMLLTLLPLELAISQASHALLKNYVPAPALLTHPLVALTAILLIGKQLNLGSSIRHFIRHDRLLLVGLLLLLLPSIYHASRGSSLDFRFLLLGCGALCLGIVAAHEHLFGKAYRPLAVGLIMWCTFIVAAYAVDVINVRRIFTYIAAYDFDQLILSLRYPGSVDYRLLYPFFVGNWNKASNEVVLGSVLMAMAILYDPNHRHIYYAAMVLMGIVNFVSFSRGGLLISAAIGAFLTVLSFRMKTSAAAQLRICALLLLLPLLLTLSFPAMRSSWLDLYSMNARLEMTKDAIKHFESTIVQEDERKTSALSDYLRSDEEVNNVIKHRESTIERADERGAIAPSDNLPPRKTHILLQEQAGSSILTSLFGMGIGVYGRQIWGSPFAGTHNMYFDILLSGGIIQLCGLMILLVYPLYVLLRSKNPSLRRLLGGLGIAAVAVLSLREFDMNYLGVSAMPALLLGLFIGVTLQGPGRDSTQG